MKNKRKPSPKTGLLRSRLPKPAGGCVPKGGVPDRGCVPEGGLPDRGCFPTPRSRSGGGGAPRPER